MTEEGYNRLNNLLRSKLIWGKVVKAPTPIVNKILNFKKTSFDKSRELTCEVRD